MAKAKLHLSCGQYEFIEIEIDDLEKTDVLALYKKYHDFPSQSPEARLKARPKDELLDNLSAL